MWLSRKVNGIMGNKLKYTGSFIGYSRKALTRRVQFLQRQNDYSNKL